MAIDIFTTSTEEGSYQYRLKQNILFPWLTTEVELTKNHLYVKQPKFIFTFIPAGKKVVSYPLRSISSVGIFSAFSRIRLWLNILRCIIFLTLNNLIIADSWVTFFNIVFAVFQARFFYRLLRQAITFSNHASERVFIPVAFTERNKIQEIVSEVNEARSKLEKRVIITSLEN